MKSFCSNVPRRFLLVPVLKEDDFIALSHGGWDMDCTQSVLHTVQRLEDRSLSVSSGCKGTWKPCVSSSVWSSYLVVHSPSQELPCVAASLLPSPDISPRLQQMRLMAEQSWGKSLLPQCVAWSSLCVQNIGNLTRSKSSDLVMSVV